MKPHEMIVCPPIVLHCNNFLTVSNRIEIDASDSTRPNLIPAIQKTDNIIIFIEGK